ncbi:MAG: ABC transporter ATP-binding protein [Roseitalea sp.]|jgi:iron(III) transport system ATP-binding protein|nr:ABC transporter ATP-binding protein [Roseitalea sp.]MBO6722288.1 ABC transporter ATP-binding protein [Roseitalea sp.]MBO6742382.1 ABC transporter ATP-binding protein [Roseitalea sp.]
MSVVLENVHKSFGTDRAVAGVDAVIATGEFFCVLGASGCGKSTLLRLIAGLETADAGTIRLGGDTVSGPGRHVSPEDRRTGFVFQSYALWPHLSVRDNVAFPGEAQGLGKAEARRQAMAHLETVSLTDFADRKPAALSGGQRQRVALARCLAGGATTILMDEPLANLDPHLRAVMEEELTRFHRASGVTTIYITHDQREAMAVADRLAVMEKGRFLQVGTPREIYERPANAAVARFIGRGTLVQATVEGGRATVNGHDVAIEGDAIDGPATAFIRPEQVNLGDAGGMEGRIGTALYRGGHWEATVLVPGIDAPVQATSTMPLAAGEPVRVAFERAWVLPG